MCSNKRAVDLCDQVAHSPPPANVLRFFFRTIVSRFLFKLLPKVTPHLLLTAYSWINKSSCVCVLLWDSLSQTHSVCLRPFSSFYFTTTKWIELVKTITRLGVFQSTRRLVHRFVSCAAAATTTTTTRIVSYTNNCRDRELFAWWSGFYPSVRADIRGDVTESSRFDFYSFFSLFPFFSKKIL